MINTELKLKNGIKLTVENFDVLSNKWILIDENNEQYKLDNLPKNIEFINYKNIEWINKSKNIYGENTFDYSQTFFTKSKNKIGLICNKHKHYFEISQASSHLGKQKTNCPICSNRNLTTEFWIEKSKKIHGENTFDYSKTEYLGVRNPIKLICNINENHGEFIISDANSHISNKQGCPICKGTKLLYSEVIEKAKKIHFDKNFTYDEISTKKHIESRDVINVFCNNMDNEKDLVVHGWFYPTVANHIYKKTGCLKCIENKGTSKGELELFNFIKNLLPNIEIVRNDRNILNPQELDIYIPELNIAFEYNGLYWHSNKPENFHLNKTNICLSKNIKLIHIFEDEWNNQKEIVKSRIANLLNNTQNKIYARKTIIKEISNKKIISDFLNNNHIQNNYGCKIGLGLYYNDELVSLMTFRKYDKYINDVKLDSNFELSRFCNKLNTNVIGGASKLLKYFEKKYKPTNIISYADRRWSNGNLYKNLNFKLSHISPPNFFYIKDGIRLGRRNFQKHKLIEKYDFNFNMTANEFIEKELKLKKIFDSGNLVFIKNIDIMSFEDGKFS